MKIYTTGRNLSTPKKQIKTIITPLWTLIKHPMHTHILGYINCSDWLNIWMIRANEMFCTIHSFCEKPCVSSSSSFACYFTSEGFGTMGKCVFSKLWLQKSVYKEWLREVKGDKHKAPGTMHGVHEGCWHFEHGRVRAHKSLERKKNIKQWHPRKGHYQASQICFGISSQRPATTSDDAKVVSKSASSESGKHTKLNSRKSFTASVTCDEMLKAEISWALKAIMSHYAYKSCEGASKLFQMMFSHRSIESQFSCGEKKCAYLICFGLAWHFKQLLKEVVKKEAYVLLFDESLNRVCQWKQMDIHIHSSNHDKHQVESRYFTSVFMGHGAADDMLSHFCLGIEGIPLQKVFQVGCCSHYV